MQTLIITTIEHNSHGQSYTKEVAVQVDPDPKEMEKLLLEVINGPSPDPHGPEDPRITYTEMKKPRDFSEAGGFASELVSVTDENDKDATDYLKGLGWSPGEFA